MTLLTACSPKTLGATVPEGTGEEQSASTVTAEADEEPAASLRKITDLEGNELLLPEKVETIASMNFSLTQILIDLGLGDKIIAVDGYSSRRINGKIPNAEDLVMMSTKEKEERLIALQPDLIISYPQKDFVSDTDMFIPVREVGIAVAIIPTDTSRLQDVKEGILYR